MKRNLSVITPKVKKIIKGWLKTEINCPFLYPEYPDCSICKAIFPTSKDNCPCVRFKLSYVRKVAEEIIK